MCLTDYAFRTIASIDTTAEANDDVPRELSEDARQLLREQMQGLTGDTESENEGDQDDEEYEYE